MRTVTISTIWLHGQLTFNRWPWASVAQTCNIRIATLGRRIITMPIEADVKKKPPQLAFWRAQESARTESRCILGRDHVKRENVDGPMWLWKQGRLLFTFEVELFVYFPTIAFYLFLLFPRVVLILDHLICARAC